MSFPSYMWSNLDFHTHRFQYWYVVNLLTVMTTEDPEQDTDAEIYVEMYSDH